MDLLIAVIGIVVSILGSSTALWMAVSKKPDREDLGRVEVKVDGIESRFDGRIDGVESRLEARMDRIEGKLDAVGNRLEGRMDRIEGKLDALILRFVPDHLPETGT
ncbi:MAG TPA: hypothetical protein VGO87_06400 [Acidimicrobiia bacterium]